MTESKAPTVPGADRPAWSREPFAPGNDLAVKHGAYSEQKLAPLADRAREQFAVELVAGGFATWILSPTFARALDAYCRTEARVALVAAWLEEHGELAEDGTPRPASSLLTQLERLGMEQRSKLGLDPASCVRIQRDLAGAAKDADIGKLMEKGRASIEANRSQSSEPPSALEEGQGEP